MPRFKTRRRFRVALLAGSALALGATHSRFVAAEASADPPAPIAKAEQPGEREHPLKLPSTQLVKTALFTEIERSRKLQLPEMRAPYFLAVEHRTAEDTIVVAQLGSLVSSLSLPMQQIRAEVRVGDYAFDNSKPGGASQVLPLGAEADYDVIRRWTWMAMDRLYKTGAQSYEQRRAQRKSQSESSDKFDDFAKVEVTKAEDDTAPWLADRRYLEHLARELSAPLREYPSIQRSGVTITAHASRRTLVTSEGSEVVDPTQFVRIEVSFSGQASDGMSISDTLEFGAPRVGALPSRTQMLEAIRKSADMLALTQSAPVVKDSSAPVWFTGQAAVQLLGGLFSELLNGTPESNYEGGATPGLARRKGQVIVHRALSVRDDPALTEYHELPLFGAYRYDDEGVPAERVELIAAGKLEGLLMSRAANLNFPNSNGHGRFVNSRESVGASSNLIIEARRGVSEALLLQKLRQQLTRDKQEHGYIVEKLSPHTYFSSLAGDAQSSISLYPTQVYRIDKAGKKQLVRGVEIKGFSLESIKNAVAFGNAPRVLHSFEGDGLPSFGMGVSGSPRLSSWVSPDVLVANLTVSKQPGENARLPLLKRPSANTSAVQASKPLSTVEFEPL